MKCSKRQRPMRLVSWGNSENAGTVANGKIADLVLLNADPLVDVDNVFRQEGVMLHGHWFSEDDLQKKLIAAVEASKAARE